MAMDQKVLDDIIERLVEVGKGPGKMVRLSAWEIRQLCVVSRKMFLSQPNLLEVEAPIKVLGDIHGQYLDLLRMLEVGGFPPSSRYLFMGNYVDYSMQSIETICLLLAYMIKYPKNFFLLRGNHESASLNYHCGFYNECKRRFSVQIWKTFIDCFNCMPFVAVIDEKILCMHGGLSPLLKDLDQIRNIPRPTDVPYTGLLCDLLWADPCRDIKGWGTNDRGVSVTFGADIVEEFLAKHDIDLICRSHQVVENGYEFFADRGMVTVFSAPNFRGMHDNAGALMSIDVNLVCSFQILSSILKRSLRGVPGAKATAEKVCVSVAAPPENKPRTPNPAQAPLLDVPLPLTRRAHYSDSQSIGQPRENVKPAPTPPRMGKLRPKPQAHDNFKRTASPPPQKGRSRPVTPAREDVNAKEAVIPTSTIKGVSRPITPAYDCTSILVSSFGVSQFTRPKTPLRPQTPFRKEQKH